jgi:hypothetical protein
MSAAAIRQDFGTVPLTVLLKLQYLSVDTEGGDANISYSYNPQACESADEFRLLGAADEK